MSAQKKLRIMPKATASANPNVLTINSFDPLKPFHISSSLLIDNKFNSERIQFAIPTNIEIPIKPENFESCNGEKNKGKNRLLFHLTQEEKLQRK